MSTTAERRRQREAPTPHPPVLALYKNRPSNCAVKTANAAKQELSEFFFAEVVYICAALGGGALCLTEVS